MELNKLSEIVIGAAIEVHKRLGPGLLESVYQQCLVYELKLKGLDVLTEVKLPIQYKELRLSEGYRLDLLVNDRLVVELKAVDKLNSVFTAQLLSYLKMGGYPLGLLINFNVPVLKQGIKRIINKPL